MSVEYNDDDGDNVIDDNDNGHINDEYDDDDVHEALVYTKIISPLW